MGPANELANASSELVTGLGRVWANHMGYQSLVYLCL